MAWPLWFFLNPSIVLTTMPEFYLLKRMFYDKLRLVFVTLFQLSYYCPRSDDDIVFS